jgi:hypothetical protein
MFLFPNLREIQREEYYKNFYYKDENPAEKLINKLKNYVSFRGRYGSAAYLYDGNILSINGHLDIFQWLPSKSSSSEVIEVNLEYPIGLQDKLTESPENMRCLLIVHKMFINCP